MSSKRTQLGLGPERNTSAVPGPAQAGTEQRSWRVPTVTSIGQLRPGALPRAPCPWNPRPGPLLPSLLVVRGDLLGPTFDERFTRAAEPSGGAQSPGKRDSVGSGRKLWKLGLDPRPAGTQFLSSRCCLAASELHSSHQQRLQSPRGQSRGPLRKTAPLAASFPSSGLEDSF